MCGLKVLRSLRSCNEYVSELVKIDASDLYRLIMVSLDPWMTNEIVRVMFPLYYFLDSLLNIDMEKQRNSDLVNRSCT